MCKQSFDCTKQLNKPVYSIKTEKMLNRGSNQINKYNHSDQKQAEKGACEKNY